jgi:radical SAM-linked protein
MERIFRRAGLPLAFSEGFNPHPKVSYGSALAVGVTSDGEYMDAELRADLPLNEIKERLDIAVPRGIEIIEIKQLVTRTKSLTAQINMARYCVYVPLAEKMEARELEQLIERAMVQPTFIVDRAGKKGKRQVDIKKGLYKLEGRLEDDYIVLQMDVQTGSEGNIRPEEVVEMIRKIGNVYLREGLQIHRLGLYIREEEDINTPFEYIS